MADLLYSTQKAMDVELWTDVDIHYVILVFLARILLFGMVTSKKH